MAIEMDRFEAPADRVLALPGDVRTGSAVIRLFDGAEGCLAAVAAAPGPIASVWLTPPGCPRPCAAHSRCPVVDRKSHRLNSRHSCATRTPSHACQNKSTTHTSYSISTTPQNETAVLPS